jgi:polysaccharide biosynthesis/export protein
LKILDAIFEAGGFTKSASENNVLILRQGPKEKEEIRVKVKDLMKDGDLGQNIALQPGDYVIVKESIF